MTRKPFSSTKEYRHAVCASCPAGMACVAGLVRGVYQCYHCGKTWAFVYILNTAPKERSNPHTLFKRVQEITILETHFEACPLRDRKAEKDFGNKPMPGWQGIECADCRELRRKQELLDKQRRQ